MRSVATTPKAYLDALPADRRRVVAKLRAAIRKNLPPGFKEEMAYGMISYVVPHTRYPAGYHVDPRRPLPFISLASQKQHVAVYHMGLYAGPLLKWFSAAWRRATDAPLDMGKGCIRLRRPDDIPYALLGELAAKLTVDQWVKAYEKATR